MIRLITLCLLGISVCLCSVNVSAQDTPPPVVIRKAPVEVKYLIDQEGKQIFFTGDWLFTDLDVFSRWVLSEQQNPVPTFILRSVSATGTVINNYVEVEAQIEIQTSTYQTVQVPLGFREGIQPGKEQTNKSTFHYTGPGSATLTTDPKEQHFVAVIVPKTQLITTESDESDKPEKPEMNQRHTLSLLFWFPLIQNGGGENRLALTFPQSNMSQLLLEVPMTNIIETVSRGIVFDKQENAERQSTVLQIQGLRGDTEISWGKKKVEIVEDRPVLLVEEASMDIRLDIPTAAVIYDAVLPVNSATSSFDQLQVRLPQGSILDREITDKYAAASDYSVGDVDDESIVTIRLQKKTTGPVSLHLKVIQQFEEGNPDAERELAGFEVLGAESQTGFLTVSVFPSDMKPHCEPIRGVIRRAEGANPNAVTPTVSSANDARFEFTSQPFRLRVRAAAPQSRINVKPNYDFHISKGTISMHARLTYTVSGTKTDTLFLRLSDSQWHYNFATSGIVDTTAVQWVDNNTGLLSIPLRSRSDGPIEVEFRAYRLITSDDEPVHRIVLPMPEPLVDWSEPATVTITSDNDVVIEPIDESSSTTAEQRITGLTRRSRPTGALRVELPELRQDPLFYRTEPTGAVFVADLIYQQRKVSATIQTEVHLFEETNQVKQTVLYDAAYVPVERLSFLLPKALEGRVQVRWENNTLDIRDTISDLQDNVPTNWVLKSVQLPEPRYQFQLVFHYSHAPLAVATESTARLPLSFVYPVEIPVTDHRVHCFTPPGYTVELQDESKLLWESLRESRRPTAESAKTFWSAQSPSPTRIALSISASEQRGMGTTVVERAWLQTWLTGKYRRDQATYLLKSPNDSVTLQLPPDAARESRVIVRIDEQQVVPNISSTGTLTLPILPEQQNRPVEVVVDYGYPFEMTGIKVPISLPAFAKEVSVPSQVWQVLLQRHKHIISCPEGWTLEYTWAWNGLFWWRIPSIQKSDIGFVSDSKTPGPSVSGASQYVFSHLQPPEHVTLYVVNRSLIVLCSSSIALLVGLVLIYVPQSRYAGSLFGLGIMLAAVLFYQPPFALLMLQAAVFGVFLALGAGYIYRIFHRQRQWIPPTFPTFEEMSQPYLSPVPVSQTVHEVVMDESSNRDTFEPPVVNNE